MKSPLKVQINTQIIEATPTKDILSIALSNGIDFPYNCRVGGCGTCKCRLISGSVRQLTDSSYLLNSEEMKSGYILACQAIPLTDLKLEVAFRTNAKRVKPTLIESDSASFFQYLKFSLFHIVGLISAISLLAGRDYISWWLFCVIAFYTIGDAILGDDTSVPNYKHPSILTAQLWLALPLISLIVFVFVWSVGSGDFAGIGLWAKSLTGYDFFQFRNETTWYHKISALVLTALMIGLIGTITAHELTHRTWDRISMLVGRWLLAFSFDTSFAIEHVYGHHKYVSTTEDPATAPRGRNVYFHIIASTFKGNFSAWKIESERLKKKGFPLFSYHNFFIRGHLMSVLLVLIAFMIGGPIGCAFFIFAAILGKALLEIVNYMEHYGIVRDPQDPVQPHHSWNSNKRISSWTMFNLTRHSHHHAQGEVPFQKLQPYPDSPFMISGYLTTIIIALIPPLWNRLMKPKLQDWDTKFASNREKLLAQEANRKA